MTLIIRNLENADLETADTILRAAFGGASRLQDLRLCRQIQPDGWFIAFQAGIAVGTVGAINYGKFAHIGLMAVHPSAQRQGIAFSLMQFLLAWLEQQQVPLVTLDASKMGHPLYDKLGFVPYDKTLVFQLPSRLIAPTQTPHAQTITSQDLDELLEWDTKIFGANRRKVFQTLLEFFPGRAFLQRDTNGRLASYLFAQKNRIGPWVMLQNCNPGELLQAALTLPYDETPTIVVPAENPEAINLLQSYGFEHVRTNRHMGRGSGGLPDQRKKICAQTSLAIG
jgi:GNAT superfamily N-acetyltransferase